MSNEVKKPAGEKLIVQNRQASFQFHIEKKIEAGIELTGSEVKSCREGRAQLVDSYATIERGECWLYKTHIAEYKQAGPHFNHPPLRKRKLLLHKRELLNLKALLEQQGYTLIPLRMYFKRSRVKVELALARGKTKGDKRAAIKEREVNRETSSAMRRDLKVRRTSSRFDIDD